MQVATRPPAAPPGWWVSTSDVLAVLECPYAYWRRHLGEVSAADAVDPGRMLLAERSPARRAEGPEGVPAPPEPGWPGLMHRRVRVVEVGTLQNAELGISGRPDAVDTEAGEAIPVEVKATTRLRPRHRVELAFHWLLTEPLRRCGHDRPRGRVVLAGEEHELELRPADVDAALALIERVRDVRAHGARPRICRCPYCAGPLQDETREGALAAGDLTLVWGLGRRRAEALEAAGVGDLRAFCALAPDALRDALRRAGASAGAGQVAAWQAGARAVLTGRPVLLGTAALPRRQAALLLDAEYDSWTGELWLVGLRVLGEDGGAHDHVLWADGPGEDRRALGELERLLGAHPHGPVVTWAGSGADLPALARAAHRAGLPEVHARLLERHLDLYALVRGHLALPTPGRGLGEVAGWCGHRAPVLAITNGIEAQLAYLRSRGARGPERDTARADLADYNRDDLAALQRVLMRVWELADT